MMTPKEYFKTKIDRQKVLLSYSASIEHAEFETVCSWDGCLSIKKKVEGLSPKDFKWLKQHVNDEFTAIKAEIGMMHELVSLEFIPAWDGYNPHEHGVYNMGLVDTIPVDKLYSIAWKEIFKRNDKLKENMTTLLVDGVVSATPAPHGVL